MREIKFRAWHKEWKMMFDVLSIDFAGGTVYVQPLGDNSGVEEIGLDEVELIQYTGLKDCEGTEIYEGYIFDTRCGVVAVVGWDNDNARVLGITIEREGKIVYIGREPKVKVIGNVWENPELLEGAK